VGKERPVKCEEMFCAFQSTISCTVTDCTQPPILESHRKIPSRKLHVLYLLPFSFLFTCQFSVKAAQADSKSLECRQRIPVIHGEQIFANLTELKNHLVMIRLSRLRRCWCTSSRLRCSNKLKVLDRGNRHSPTEIKAPALQLFMPSW